MVKKYLVRDMTEEMYRAMKYAALDNGETLKDFILKAIQERIDKKSEKK